MSAITRLERLTPKIARELLKRNTDNRDLRPSHVETLRTSFSRGEYVTTHQGIAFDIEGALLDGQHRLHAIAAMPDDWFCHMLVTKGLPRTEAFRVIDAVQAKRSTSDVLGTDRSVGECANFFAKLHLNRSSAITPAYASPFAEWLLPYYTDLTAFSGRKCKTWSSAPVRSAAFVAMCVGHDTDYVKLVYRALVSADFTSMPPVAQALFRSHMSGKVRAAAAYDIFCRCIKVFDPKNSNLAKVQINDQSAVIQSVRDLLDAEVFGKKKRAVPVAPARKSVSGTNYALSGL
ncbi:MAG: hypothetical protein V4669_13870 [Pseudomonadota bacterium]